MFSQEHLALRRVRLRASGKWTGPAHGLAFVFPNGGQGRFVSAAGTHRLCPGDILVLNGAPGGSLFADGGGDLTFWFFAARLEHLFPLFAGGEISRLPGLAESFKVPRHHHSSSPLARECHQLLADTPPRFSLVHRGQLLRVIAALLAEQFKSVPRSVAGFVRAGEHMVQVFEQLSADELAGLSVGELSARFGCSKRQLNRLFRRHFGFSVAAMRMEMRLLKAVSLLRDPDAKIINVAEQCGFHHLGQFNTCFKRRFGASPTQYRKTLAPAESPPGQPDPRGPVCPLRSHGFCAFAPKDAKAPTRKK